MAASGAAGVARYELGSGTTLLVPHTLQALLGLGVWEAGAATGAEEDGGAVRVVAGNTGVGIYKDWAVGKTLVDINKVRNRRVARGGGLQMKCTVCGGGRRACICSQSRLEGFKAHLCECSPGSHTHHVTHLPWPYVKHWHLHVHA